MGIKKIFLSVVIDYPVNLENWKNIKKQSSQDKERNFTVYQMIKIHNKIFEGKSTNIIEFGTDRGGTLTTISKFIKNNSNIYAVGEGFHAEEIKKMFQYTTNIIRQVQTIYKKLGLKILIIKK